MAADEGSSYLLAETKRRDPDRYLCALFAPADRRDSVLALVLFNDELARIPIVVTQPMTGLIRLQWWRDALDELAAGGRPRRHPVVEALADLLVKGHAAPHALHAMIDAREPALDGTTGTETAAVEAFARTTAGALQGLIYRALGGAVPREAEAAVMIGTATGLLAMARAVAVEATERRQAAEVESLSRTLLARAADLLQGGRAAAGRPARERMAAFLPAVLAEARLRRWPDQAERRLVLAPLSLLARVVLRRP